MRWDRARRARIARAGVLGVVVCVAAAVPPAAGYTPPLGTYGGAVVAMAISVSGETNQFSGLPALLSVPYVTAVLESSPAGVASATVFDLGPLGQAGVATGNQYAFDYGAPEQMRLSQPQYATARYPGKPEEVSRSSVGGADPSGAGSAEAASASAAAAADKVEARAEVAGARMLAPAGSPSPGGAQASPWIVRGEALSSTGRIVATATHISYEAKTSASDLEALGGLIRIGSMRSLARATMGVDGTATESELVVGGVSIAGVPVVITQDGPKVAEEGIPGGPDGLRDARARLREALAPSAVDVRVLDSERREARTETGSLEARTIVGGIRIGWTTPSPNASVPAQRFAVVLGGADAGGHAELPDEIAPGTTHVPSIRGGDQLPAFTFAPTPSPTLAVPPADADDDEVRVLGTSVAGKSHRSGGGLLAMFALWNVVVVAVLVSARRRGMAAAR